MEQKIAVVLRSAGANEKTVQKTLQKKKGFSASGAKELVKARPPQAVAFSTSREEAEELKADLERNGAGVTIEPVCSVEAWLSLKSDRISADEMLDITAPILVRASSGRPFEGRDTLFTLADQVGRGTDYPEMDEEDALLLYSSLENQQGERIFVSYTVCSAAIEPKEYRTAAGLTVTNGYAVYYKALPFVLLAPTEADCRAGNFLRVSWEDTPEKALLVPVGGETLRLENPFREVVGIGEDAQKTAAFCPLCGAPAAPGDRFCGKCGKKLQ